MTRKSWNALEGALITTSESPLKIDRCSPNSTTNWQALLATKVSSRSTVARRATFIDKAASTSPLSLHTTTSIPASLVSTNTATIKVCFQFISTRMSPFHRGFALISRWNSRPLMKLWEITGSKHWANTTHEHSEIFDAFFGEDH